MTETPEFTSELFVQTDRPDRYVKQLVSHLTRDRDNGDGKPPHPAFIATGNNDGTTLARTIDGQTPSAQTYSRIRVRAGEGILLNHFAADQDALQNQQDVVSGHLYRFVHGRDAAIPEHR